MALCLQFLLDMSASEKLLALLSDDTRDQLDVRVAARRGPVDVHLTNLNKIYWPERGYRKRELVLYYCRVAGWLLPHLRDRAMVMKRYPDGIQGPYFFMKRAPSPRPDWINTCQIVHRRAGPVNYPIVQDLASLLWLVNLGCIDLNPWYAACGDYDRPDDLNFDLDPGEGAGFEQVLQSACLLRDYLGNMGISSYPKTTGSRGLHVYVPIRVGPVQKDVWYVAKRIAMELEASFPRLITAQYRKEKRPPARVLIDYNQNAWGRTLASVYSVRPVPLATVSAPLTWREVEEGVAMERFDIESMPERLRKVGDLWKPLLLSARRLDLVPWIEWGKWKPAKTRAA